MGIDGVKPQGFLRTIISEARLRETQRRASTLDPFKITPNLRTYLISLFSLHRPASMLDRAILILRAAIAPSETFEVNGRSFPGLSLAQKGLQIQLNDDFNHLLREKGSGYLLPDQLLAATRTNRVALCAEFSFLLVTLLRTAKIESFVKITSKHAYVLAKIEGKLYKIDATLPVTFKEVPVSTEISSDDDARFWYFAASSGIMVHQNRIEQAIEYAQCALLIREDANLLASLARLYNWRNSGSTVEQQRDRQRGMEILRRAISLDPQNQRAQRAMSEIYPDAAQ